MWVLCRLQRFLAGKWLFTTRCWRTSRHLMHAALFANWLVSHTSRVGDELASLARNSNCPPTTSFFVSRSIHRALWHGTTHRGLESPYAISSPATCRAVQANNRNWTASAALPWRRSSHRPESSRPATL